MTKAPELVEIEIELSDEERDAITAKAKSVGIDMETYIRLRGVTSGELPEPAGFFALFRRLSEFARDYESCMRAFAEFNPSAMAQSDALAKTFAGLLQDWGALYGPR